MNKPLTLRQKQSLFLKNAAKLITYAYTLPGYELTGGELYRSEEQQAIHIKNGASKAARSRHQDKLAIDLNLFINGVYQTGKTGHEPLGKYWKSLHSDNVWGGDWGWDANHYEMKP